MKKSVYNPIKGFRKDVMECDVYGVFNRRLRHDMIAIKNSKGLILWCMVMLMLWLGTLRAMCEIYLELNLTLWETPNEEQELLSTQKDSFSYNSINSIALNSSTCSG